MTAVDLDQDGGQCFRRRRVFDGAGVPAGHAGLADEIALDRSISSNSARYSPQSTGQGRGDSEFSLSRIPAAQAPMEQHPPQYLSGGLSRAGPRQEFQSPMRVRELLRATSVTTPITVRSKLTCGLYAPLFKRPHCPRRPSYATCYEVGITRMFLARQRSESAARTPIARLLRARRASCSCVRDLGRSSVDRTAFARLDAG